MSKTAAENQVCLIIGASHAGVNCAFSLRSAGWTGEIVLIDSDPELPYHRPPLSKTYLAAAEGTDLNPLRSADNYVRENISLRLGETVQTINRDRSSITLGGGVALAYDKLVLAVGARPLIPPIPGLEAANHVYPLRSAADVENIRRALAESAQKRVVVIGGGYIGLETAASLAKLGAEVTVLEREDRVLARVTTLEMSAFFEELHAANGVRILTAKLVSSIAAGNIVSCGDGDDYPADLIILGCGIRVNTELAREAGIKIENGICVDAAARTSDENIYAVGDCAYHHNPHYGRFVRLESVQNAVDQAKVAAKAIMGEEIVYDAIPWFWSDQYDVKLQIVGLSSGYDQAILRLEHVETAKLSIWYFLGDRLLSVDAINNAKAYVIGTKLIKSGGLIDKEKLVDSTIPLKPANILQG